MNFILKNENGIFYETNFTCDNVIFLQLSNEKFFITDARYSEEAKESVYKDVNVIESSNLIKSLSLLIRGRIKLFFDPFEWNIEEFDFLNKTLKNVSFEKKRYLSKFKRIIKNSKEISFLEQAVKIGRNSIHDFQKKLQSGKTEQELHFQLENNLRHFGKYDLSFNPILAINNNASKPHSLPTNKILKKGDLILIDAGVKYNRYCSDRTETISFKGTFSNKVQKIYDVVQKAHDKAIKKIRSGISADEVDKIARNVIEKAGFGKNFIHSTGHGVGLDIHEFPNISSRSKTKIKNGMVFTIEPAIYIPNFIGIRIENMVVIENEKARIL